jgi:hypothetical protein
MFSPTLLIAVLFYLVGVGVVLYVRPTSMFRPGGVWREFGLSDSEHSTLFPFWMFTLVWAVLSYAIATCIIVFISSSLAPSEGIEILSEPNIQPVSSIAPLSSLSSPSPSSSSSSPSEPGYYILNPDTINSSGANYIYYGSKPPTPQELNSFVRQRR